MSKFCTVVILLALLCPGCKSRNVSVRKMPQETSSELDENRFARLAAGELHDNDKASEARAWLDPKNTNNVLWKTSRADTLEYVNKLYEAGAVKVFCIYSPKDSQVRVNLCASLLVELPRDKEQRKKVIRVFNKLDRELWGEDADQVKDEGQQFLCLNMDP